MTEKRGRPKKSVNTININDLLCEYISMKTDKYDNAIVWYKIVDPNYKQKMSPILSQQCDECKMPFFKTEDNAYMLKVKKKYTPKTMIDNGDIVTLNLMFKYYCMEKDDGLIQGYYAKILSYDDDKENN